MGSEEVKPECRHREGLCSNREGRSGVVAGEGRGLRGLCRAFEMGLTQGTGNTEASEVLVEVGTDGPECKWRGRDLSSSLSRHITWKMWWWGNGSTLSRLLLFSQ